MSEQSSEAAKQREGRTRASVAVIASLVIFCLVAMTLWAVTTLGLFYALASATPVTVIVACSIVLFDSIAEFFAAIVEGIVEALGAVVAGILAALAAVFGIFGG
jgi:hypothetical protein